MVTCGQCQAVVFVDINGEAHLNSPDPLTENAPVHEPMVPFLSEEPEQNDQSGQTFEPVESFEAAQSFEPLPDFELNQEIEPLQDSVAELAAKSEPEEELTPLPDLNFDQYANSEKDLPALSYTLRISGLEHPQKLKEALEILREPRLALDEQLIQQVKATGSLDLERLTAVKASYLVKMLLLKQITVTWRQNVFN